MPWARILQTNRMSLGSKTAQQTSLHVLVYAAMRCDVCRGESSE